MSTIDETLSSHRTRTNRRPEPVATAAVDPVAEQPEQTPASAA